MNSYQNTAIVFGSLKDALLHFEYVIPMNFTGEFMGLRPLGNGSGGSVENFKEPGIADYNELVALFSQPDELQKLYPPHLRKLPTFKHAVNMFDGFLFSYMVRATCGEDAFRRYVEHLSRIVDAKGPIDPDLYCPTIEGLQRLFRTLAGDFQLFEMPVDCSQFTLGDSKDSIPTNQLLVPQIRVIDTEKVSLSQIMEFRENKETMKKMRNFRLFAYQQYSAQDKAFIEDDIQKRFDDYSEAVRSCGFETTIKTLSFLFESKFLMGAFATSAASLLLGNAQAAIGAFSTGAIVELGKLSLEYAKQKHALAKICYESPVSYIADVKKQLEAGHG